MSAALNVITFPRPDRLPPFVAANYIADPHEQARQKAEAEAAWPEWEAPMAEDVPTLPERLFTAQEWCLLGAAACFTTAIIVFLLGFGGIIQ